MRLLVTLIVIAYLIGVGVALAPTIKANWSTAPTSRIRRKRCGGTADSVCLAGDGISQHRGEAQRSREAQCAPIASMTTSYTGPLPTIADPKASTLRAVQAALEAAGGEFTNGKQPGVRMAAKD